MYVVFKAITPQNFLEFASEYQENLEEQENYLYTLCASVFSPHHALVHSAPCRETI